MSYRLSDDLGRKELPVFYISAGLLRVVNFECVGIGRRECKGGLIVVVMGHVMLGKVIVVGLEVGLGLGVDGLLIG